jgi:diaminohydroxyphosphoribosylaminopyrimidine deaminase/5-amino-6-(5-phosphoribosylamino)uracil reductase
MENADIRWMRRALVLARRGEGATRPNPPVGAVVVRGGRKLGEGWHAGAGLPHAEVNAIAACRGDPAGATLYVTLEPCSTQGRTPPCTDRIIRAGIARVVSGCPDPNPRHASRGFDVLRRAGIAADVGCCGEACAELIAPFAKRLSEGLPYVTLKLAMTLDGKIADRRGRSKWITGEAARAQVQELRRRADAVMVGAGTVCADDPALTCRLPGCGDRWRVVIDGRGRVPPRARIFSDGAPGPTVVCTASGVPHPVLAAASRNSVQVWPFAARDGRFSLRAALRRLASAGVMHVLCEGGGALAGALLRADLVDECVIFLAPAFLADPGAPGVAGAGFLLERMPRFALAETRVLGDDVMIRVTRRRSCSPV